MSAIDNNIKRVNIKLQQLLKQYQLLQKENERLKITAGKLEEQNAQLGETVGQLEQKVHILKAAAGQMEELDKKALEKKINLYLKEIDKCIALLSE